MSRKAPFTQRVNGVGSARNLAHSPDGELRGCSLAEQKSSSLQSNGNSIGEASQILQKRYYRLYTVLRCEYRDNVRRNAKE